jgi:hypothetical protein
MEVEGRFVEYLKLGGETGGWDLVVAFWDSGRIHL